MASRYSQHFPNLTDVEKKKTSEATKIYNCIAWAFKDNMRHWWPDPQRSYWPLDINGKSAMEAFEDLFASRGWEETTNNMLEEGYEKIALYAKGGNPTHAARLLPNGHWTSKLGQDIDISHDINELNGPAYGAVHKVYRRKI